MLYVRFVHVNCFVYDKSANVFSLLNCFTFVKGRTMKIILRNVHTLKICVYIAEIRLYVL